MEARLANLSPLSSCANHRPCFRFGFDRPRWRERYGPNADYVGACRQIRQHNGCSASLAYNGKLQAQGFSSPPRFDHSNRRRFANSRRPFVGGGVHHAGGTMHKNCVTFRIGDSSGGCKFRKAQL
jgi:hypothetical protein